MHALVALHIAHWLLTGRTLAPLEFNEALHSLHLGVITAGFLFMALTVLVTLAAGRFFCSWACHILALEDLSAWILHRLHLRPKPIRSRVLAWVPGLAALYLFIWPQVERLANGSGLVSPRVQSDAQGWGSFVTSDFWRNLPGPGISILTLSVVGGVAVWLLGTRSFCRYACPYGAIFGLADRVAPARIKLIGDCSQCGLCTAACQSQVLVHREVLQLGRVVSSDCLKDLDCVAVCPKQALAYGRARPAFMQSLDAAEYTQRGFSFTGIEEVSVAVTTLALLVVYRGLYDVIPFLLALTIAVVGAVVLVTGFRRRPRTEHGPWRSALAAGFLLFSVHSAFVHHHAASGRRALLRATGHEGLSSSGPPEGGRVVDPADLEAARVHLRTAEAAGLWTSPRLGHDLATVHLYAHERDAAEQQLLRVLKKAPKDLPAAVRLGHLALSLNRTTDAERYLQPIFVANEDRFGPETRALRSRAYVLAGQIAERRLETSKALAHYESAAHDDPQNGEAHLAMGTLYARLGRLEEASGALRRAEVHYPERSVVLNNLALVSLGLGQHAEAIEQLRELLDLQPDRAETRYQLAVALLGAGEIVEAGHQLEAALVLKPGYVLAEQLRAKLLESPAGETHDGRR